MRFYKMNSLDYYELRTSYCGEKNRLCLANQEGESGDFPIDQIGDVIYQAIDKYFKEKF